MTIDPEVTQAINTAARRMTDAAPSPALRSRVMTRIAARRAWTPWRLALAGGTLGAAALVAVVAWPRAVATPDTPGPIVTSAAVTPATATPAFDDVVVVAAPVFVAMPAAVTAANGVVSAPDPAPAPEWRLREVPALPPPDPITLSTIDINPLVVGPLTTASGGGR